MSGRKAYPPYIVKAAKRLNTWLNQRNLEGTTSFWRYEDLEHDVQDVLEALGNQQALVNNEGGIMMTDDYTGFLPEQRDLVAQRIMAALKDYNHNTKHPLAGFEDIEDVGVGQVSITFLMDGDRYFIDLTPEER